MTSSAWVFLAIAAACAFADWIVVSPGTRRRHLEYVFKPLTIVALIAVAIALRPENSSQRAWFVVALVLSLAGDVFLMLPADLFVPGLGSFLMAHVAYIVGFAIAGLSIGEAGAGLVLVLIAAATIGVRITREVRARHAPLLAPVTIYMAAISAMVVLGFGSAKPLAIGGALLFYASDTMIAWDRFVRPFAWARPAIMSTYHVAQAALVLSLVP